VPDTGRVIATARHMLTPGVGAGGAGWGGRTLRPKFMRSRAAR
jgi:hypothetical protein